MSLNVDGLRKQLRRDIAAFADRAADGITAEVANAAPVESGALKRSVEHTRPVVTDARTTFTVRTGNLIQAETTEFGASPHIIRPKPGGRLAWQSKRTGKLVVLKVDQAVDHPGNPARPWFYPALDKWPQVAERVWRRVSR